MYGGELCTKIEMKNSSKKNLVYLNAILIIWCMSLELLSKKHLPI